MADPLMPNESSLDDRFARVWTASTISNLGDGVLVVAFPLLAASLTRSPLQISLVAAAGQMPWLLFSLVSGALVDRWDRRTVMWTTDAYRLVIVVGVAAGVLAGWVSMPVLIFAALLLGSGELLFDNAAQSILPSIVAADQLERANSRLYSAQVVTNQFVGGPVGGALFALGRSLPFVVDAVSFGVSAVLVGTLRGDYKAQRTDATASLWTDVKEGVLWLWGHRLLRTLSLEVGITNFCIMAYLAVFVLHAQDNLGVGDFGYGALIAVGGAGALAGATVASRVSAAIALGPLLFALVFILGMNLVVIGVTSSPIMAGAAIAAMGFIIMVWNVVTVSLRQAITPDELLGRVNSAYQVAAMGMAPLGAVAGGLLASWLGLRAPMLIGGLALAATAVAVSPIVNTDSIRAARAEAT